MNKIYTDDLFNTIVDKTKVTIFKPNELTPYWIYGTIESIEVKPSAQYNNSLFITFKEYRKRNTTLISITEPEAVYILEGRYNKCWNRISLDENTSELKRITKEDILKDDVNIIMEHHAGDVFVDDFDELMEDFKIVY